MVGTWSHRVHDDAPSHGLPDGGTYIFRGLAIRPRNRRHGTDDAVTDAITDGAVTDDLLPVWNHLAVQWQEGCGDWATSTHAAKARFIPQSPSKRVSGSLARATTQQRSEQNMGLVGRYTVAPSRQRAPSLATLCALPNAMTGLTMARSVAANQPATRCVQEETAAPAVPDTAVAVRSATSFLCHRQRRH